MDYTIRLSDHVDAALQLCGRERVRHFVGIPKSRIGISTAEMGFGNYPNNAIIGESDKIDDYDTAGSIAAKIFADELELKANRLIQWASSIRHALNQEKSK